MHAEYLQSFLGGPFLYYVKYLLSQNLVFHNLKGATRLVDHTQSLL